MNATAAPELSTPLEWPEPGYTSVPYRVYSDEEIYRLEHQKIFRGPIWNFICLEAEIPNRGDYKTSWIGEIPVVAPAMVTAISMC